MHPGIKFWIVPRCPGDTKNIEKSIFLFLFRWTHMVLTQCDSLAVFWKSKWWEFQDKRGQTARRNYESHKCSHVCSECQRGWKFKTSAGKRQEWLCWCAVSCCGVLCCVVLWCAVDVGVIFFAHFLTKNALPSIMFAFRSLWSSKMTSCFFASRSCFKHFSRLQALPEMRNR